MNKCVDCGKKLTCCKCGKLLCKPNGTVDTHGVESSAAKPCKIIGYYKIAEDIICTTCRSH